MILDVSGRAVRAVGTTEDVTEQRAAEERLRDAEERYRTLVETIPAMLYVTTASMDMRELYLSPQVESLLGITFELFQSQGRSWSDFVHPDDREQLEWQSREFFGSGGARFALSEYRLVRPDGRVIWVQDRAALLHDDSGEPEFTQGLVFDITAQKEAGDLLRGSEAAMERSLEVLQRTDDERRKLMARVLSAEEQDRERMAVGIEDGSIQHMAAVGMRLETLKRALSDEHQLGALDQLGRSVDQALGRLKHLLVELRPRALETDGLSAALGLYLREAGSDAGFEASLDDRLASEPDLKVRTTAYRIAHEALTNVRLHAKARRVDVSLEDRDGGVAVLIADNGKGFDLETGAGGTDGLGLASMRERAELEGGWLRVRSKPGAGTSVEFWLPGGGGAARP